MEYISAEEFLKQPEEVQNIFINYTSKLNDWETSLFSARDEKFRKSKFPLLGSQIDFFVNEYGKDIIPLLTEGQLRKFILEKTKMHCVEVKMVYSSFKHTIIIRNGDLYWEFKEVDRDLFQALWKVALEVAKESVTNE
ncbi:hypothetical protein [Clostridium beijerinckii]|uniref:hypothetical protein n=1 Tax=Clostridium beijerinckii TaxID=1520 RepID=UPI00047E8CC9|nr:hypothetical protein [Clostridium beijerinckii]